MEVAFLFLVISVSAIVACLQIRFFILGHGFLDLIQVAFWLISDFLVHRHPCWDHLVMVDKPVFQLISSSVAVGMYVY